MAKVPLGKPKRKFDYSLLSVILAAMVIAEGAALTVGARQIDLIESMGTGLYAITVILVGMQLMLLGVVALFAMILNGDFLRNLSRVKRLRNTLFSDRPKLVTLMEWVPAVVGAIVVVQAFVVAYVASPMTIQGIGGIRGFWLAGFGAQLFILGMGMTALCVLRERMDLRTMIRSSVFLLIATAGLFVFGIADTAYVAGIGGIRESTVEIMGLQLFAVALSGLLLICLNGRSILGRKIKGRKLGTLGIIAISVVLCIQGMVVVSIGANFSIGTLGGLERTMVVGGIALALLSLLIPVSFYFMERKDTPVQSLAHSISLFLVFMLPFSLLM
jgi:hypothetical protein